MKLTGVCLIAAPLCSAAYGIARLIGRMDGRYGPGLDWEVAHILNLVGLVLFVPAVVGLRRSLPRTRSRELWSAVTLAGIFTLVVQFAVDIVAGLASDKAGMVAISGRFSSLPGLKAVFYQVGPPLLYLGLFALTILLVRTRLLAWWSPVLIVAGSGLAAVSLDLIPVGALCLLAAVAPVVVRPQPDRGEREPAAI